MKKIYLFCCLFALGSIGWSVAEDASPTDEIVVKATNTVIFQMNSNLKLTQDQDAAVEPIIASGIAKVRNLQQHLRDGDMDAATMNSQRQQVIDDENQQLSSILSPDQMRLWLNIQGQSSDSHRHSR